MTHRARDGSLKLVRRCSLPLTAAGCISTVITDIGVLDVRGDHFSVREWAPGVSIDHEQLASLLHPA